MDGAALRRFGFDFFTGVACSILAPLIRDLEREGVYRPAVREDLAVGLAAGAYLGGRWPAILMQNSGLGYCLNALTSLNLIYRIPALLVVGYRGYGGRDGGDAPEHWVMGAHCEALLQEVGIPVWVPQAGQGRGAFQAAAEATRRQRIPAAVFLRKGVLK